MGPLTGVIILLGFISNFIQKREKAQQMRKVGPSAESGRKRPTSGSWQAVLGVDIHPSRSDIERAFLNRIHRDHPDVGGDAKAWERVLWAKTIADEWLKSNR